nr:hypothetical protein [Tanacetum cinerariifolium]
MTAILEKLEHNVDFHKIVDFVEASHIRYALTINPTVYVSHIRQFWSTARIKTTNEGTKILAIVDGKPMTISESLIRRNLKLNDEEGISSLPDIELFENLALMGYNILPNQNSLFKRVNFPSVAVSYPYHYAMFKPKKYRQQTEMASKIKAQDLEISSLKARIKLLEDKDRGSVEPSGDDAPIKGRSMEIGEEVRVKRSTERGSNDTKEMVNVLTSMDAVNILISGVADVSVPLVAEVLTIGVPTVSGLVPTVSAIFTTASMIDEQVAKEIEEGIAREDQRMNEQLVRHAEIARLHAKEELKMMIEGLDRSNEMIEKHLQEYEQSAADLTIGEKIELINDLESFKKLKAAKVSGSESTQEIPTDDLKEITKEDVQNMLEIVPVLKFRFEALQGVNVVIAPELVSTAEPTVFDDKDKLHDEEVQKVAAIDEQERADMEKALELQRQLDEREDHIDWSAIAEQVKERQSDSIKRYQDLKKKPVSVAQAKKNM